MQMQRRPGESFESFLRRFNRRLLGSGKLFQARKIRFFKKQPSKTKQRATALRRKQLKERFTYLEKIGKLPEEMLEKKRPRP